MAKSCGIKRLIQLIFLNPLFFSPCVDNPQSPGLHAVDRPVCDSLRVADADGESAVVGSDQIDSRALLALDFKRRAFAPIFG